jgi:hypothetical protein
MMRREAAGRIEVAVLTGGYILRRGNTEIGIPLR